MSDGAKSELVPPEKVKGEEAALPAWVTRIVEVFEEPDPPLSVREQMEWRKMATRELERLNAFEWRNLEHWQRAWFQWLVLVYELVVATGVDLSAEACDQDCPKWVGRLERRLGGIWVPSVNIGAIARSPALQIGGVVGNEYSMWARVREHAMPGAEVLKAEGREFLLALLERLKTHRLDRVRRAVGIALEQPLAEAKPFFRGFSAGVNTDAFAPEEVLLGDQRLSLTYHLLYFHWPYIEELETVTECYCWLRSQLGRLAGPKLAELGLRGLDRAQNPGYERLRKIFQRLGKSFADPERHLVTGER
ncbi:MAG: hypothetical protein ACOYMV_12895 [Verrucomicrobiia bacterium]